VPESGVRTGEFLVAVDVQASARPNDVEGRVRLASLIDREWLTPTACEIVHRIDDAGVVRAVELTRYDALILSEKPTKVDDDVALRLLTDAWIARGPASGDVHLINRMKFAGLPVDVPELVRSAARGAHSLSAIRLEHVLAPDMARALDRNAPEYLEIPSGRLVRLEYAEDGTVSASAKLQELFGLAETPRIGARREPVVLSLLAPNGRPVQVTRDLRSFWDRTYADVRKELRGRYPKHPWPEDPWNAPPTARTTRRAAGASKR